MKGRTFLRTKVSVGKTVRFVSMRVYVKARIDLSSACIHLSCP